MSRPTINKIMRFYCKSETAHELTKAAKKNGFYFRTLTATDKPGDVYCEATAPGIDYINESGIDVRFEDHRARIGQRIAELRKAKGMTQGDLAKASGVTLANISRMERGMYSPGLDVLTKIADALGTMIEIV